MQHIATVHAYDMLDQVFVSASVREKDAFETDWETVVFVTVSISSDGESQPQEWLREALIAMIEAL